LARRLQRPQKPSAESRRRGGEDQGGQQVKALPVAGVLVEALGRAAGERQGQKSGPGAAALQQAGGGKRQGEGQRDGAGAAPGGGFDLPVPLVGEQVERLGLAALFFTGAVHGKSLLQV